MFTSLTSFSLRTYFTHDHQGSASESDNLKSDLTNGSQCKNYLQKGHKKVVRKSYNWKICTMKKKNGFCRSDIIRRRYIYVLSRTRKMLKLCHERAFAFYAASNFSFSLVLCSLTSKLFCALENDTDTRVFFTFIAFLSTYFVFDYFLVWWCRQLLSKTNLSQSTSPSQWKIDIKWLIRNYIVIITLKSISLVLAFDPSGSTLESE